MRDTLYWGWHGIAYFFYHSTMPLARVWHECSVPFSWAPHTFRMNKTQYKVFSSIEFLDLATLLGNKKSLNIAAFQLHQAAERAYNAVILVFTGYKPQTHNLGKFGAFPLIFPRLWRMFSQNNTGEEKELFKLLKKRILMNDIRKPIK